MDATLIKFFMDAGTVGIVVFLLIQVLSAYKLTVNRVVDLLEHEIKADNPDEPTK